MKLLKGKTISQKILQDLKKRIHKEKANPGLAVVLVGKDKASEIYVNLKGKAARKIGMNFTVYKFSEKAKESGIIKKIKELNADKKVSGIIVQLPLPKKFRTQKILDAIAPRKDADGFSAKSYLDPVFPKAILKLIESCGRKLLGKKAIIIANSDKFGKIMVSAAKNKKITGEYILAKNIKKNLQKIQKADVVISAAGKPGLIKGDMLKKGVIVIDGGITKIGKKVLGDIDPKSVKFKASYLSPVPGGVGPVTIACLLENVYLSSTFRK